MRKIITRAVILGFVGVGILLLGFGYYLRSKQPQRSGELYLSGLFEPVEVLYDQWAIPHIYAQNDRDAYFALGYLHAQDRLFQMEMIRRLANGELSEILGPETLKFDKLFRTLGVHHISEATLKRLDKNSLAFRDVESYVQGINLFIKDGKAPVEFDIMGIPMRPFELSDPYSIAGYMAFSFVKAVTTDPMLAYVGLTLGEDFLAELEPSFKMQSTVDSKHQTMQFLKGAWELAQSWDSLQQRFGLFDGSNAWVIAGSRTRSGKPILANDPHINFSAPSVWFEAYLKTPTLSVYGHHIAGVPIALLGHNEYHAWGLTMLQNDNMDFFKEKANPDNPDQVWFQDHWEDVKKREERIKVKGADDVFLAVKTTRHGPIVNEIVDGFNQYEEPISAWWDYGSEENEVFLGFYELARSHGLEDAERAVSKIHSPGLNVVYANADGDIAWWTAARFPIRTPESFSKVLLDGSSGKDEFLGFYPFSSNPSQKNPKKGFIASANQDSFTSYSFRVPGYFNPPDRFDMIEKHLEDKTSDWTSEDVRSLHLNTEHLSYRRLLDVFLPIVAEKALSSSELSQKAYSFLVDWDFQHRLNSQGATVFHELLANMIQLVFHEKLTDVYYDTFLKSHLIHMALDRVFTNENSPWLTDRDGKSQRAELIGKAWNLTIANLQDKLGSDPKSWLWSRVHDVEHKHILGKVKPLDLFFNVGPFVVEGSTEVINNFLFAFSPGHKEVFAGPSTRRVIDFGNPTHSLGINPTGQSGYFANHHYRDQAALFHKGEYRLQLMEKADLESGDLKRLWLRPGKSY